MHPLLRFIVLPLALMIPSVLIGASAADNSPLVGLESTETPNDGTEGVESATERSAPDISAELLCDTLASSARENGIPISFFSNLIWQESHFVFEAVSRAGAQGIAQFMPKTAAAMGLKDPFDPIQALPASARLIRDLLQRYGNLGLAAAAYNAGEPRVNTWLSRRSGLPQETRNYVLTITGLPVEQWKPATSGPQAFKLARRMPCRDHEAFAADVADQSVIGQVSPPKPTASQRILSRMANRSVTKRHFPSATALKFRRHQPMGSIRTATAVDKHPTKHESKRRLLVRTAKPGIPPSLRIADLSEDSKSNRKNGRQAKRKKFASNN